MIHNFLQNYFVLQKNMSFPSTASTAVPSNWGNRYRRDDCQFLILNFYLHIFKRSFL